MHGNGTISVTATCYPPMMYFENASDGSTIWHGHTMWMLRQMAPYLPRIEVVTDLSPSNTTLRPIQTLADGRADMAVHVFGFTAARHACFVDVIMALMKMPSLSDQGWWTFQFLLPTATFTSYRAGSIPQRIWAMSWRECLTRIPMPFSSWCYLAYSWHSGFR